MGNYYDILGIVPAATRDEIKQAYRNLARTIHPDMRPHDAQATEEFKQLNEAYQTLINVEKREKYDADLKKKSALSTNHASVSVVKTVATPPTPSTYTTTYYSDENIHRTHAFIRVVFIVILITLFAVIGQVLLFMQTPSPGLIDRSALDVASDETPTIVLSTSIPLFERESIEPLSSQLLEDATATCTIRFDTPENTCADVAGIEIVQPITDGNSIISIDVLPEQGISRVLLRVEYDGIPDGWSLNIGDSSLNTGSSGDDVAGIADAQVSIYRQDLLIYGNEINANEQLERYINVLPADGVLYVEVGHMEMKWSVGDLAEAIQSRYLFLLDGNRYGRIEADQRIFAAFNRSIASTSLRRGAGVRRVTIWLLP